MAPQQDAAGLAVIRHADAVAGGEGAGKLAMPGADLPRIAVVRRAEGVDQPVDPGLRVGKSGPGACGDAEGNRLGAALGSDAAHRRRRLVERLVPGDPLPARVRVALWPGAAHRVKQPVGRFDQCRRSAPLGAKGFAGRVRWVRLDRHKAPVLDDRLATAARGAEWAECWYAATGAVGHRRLDPDASSAFGSMPGSGMLRDKITPPGGVDKAKSFSKGGDGAFLSGVFARSRPRSSAPQAPTCAAVGSLLASTLCRRVMLSRWRSAHEGGRQTPRAPRSCLIWAGPFLLQSNAVPT